MQPYPNPNYFQQYNPMMQQQRLQQMEQMYPQFAQPQIGLMGKVVDDTSNININDVSMDGRWSVFPKSDMSEIVCKRWKNDGTIESTSYKPILGTQNSEVDTLSTNDINQPRIATDELTEVFTQRFDKLEKQIEEIMSSFSKNQTSKTSKKENE